MLCLVQIIIILGTFVKKNPKNMQIMKLFESFYDVLSVHFLGIKNEITRECLMAKLMYSSVRYHYKRLFSVRLLDLVLCVLRLINISLTQ